MPARWLTAPLTLVLLLLGMAFLATPAFAEADRVTICHLPQGNGDNPQTITVGVRSVSAHLAHGDVPVPCDDLCDDASECDDGNACTADSCGGSQCVNTPIDPSSCDDQNECTADSCDPATGCVNQGSADLEGLDCEDFATCTLNTVCDASGTCGGGELDTGCCATDQDCDAMDLDLCTEETCMVPQGETYGACVTTFTQTCQDSECISSNCNPATGACVDTPQSGDVCSTCDGGEGGSCVCDSVGACVDDNVQCSQGGASCEADEECCSQICVGGDPAGGRSGTCETTEGG